ncbi:MAG: inositol phosphorylceramide synthase [Bacteroidetes bacterium]|nr:inositol phosphorylceramide synthase [Bacteroidota bacterium]
MVDHNVRHDITVNPRSVIVISLISLGYLVISYFLVGFKSDQLIFIGLANALFYASNVSRKFLIAYLTFAGYWIIFDYMKAFPNYNYATVHIAGLYNTEKHLFGLHYHGQLITLNEYFKLNSNTLVDVMSGLFYLCWIPVPFGFGVYLFFTNRRECLLFTLTFVLLNFVGFIGYYTYPAAPPWYVQDYGFVFHPHMHEGIAGLARFDAYFHANIFGGLYTKGSNVFAAMPSLHSAYPILVFYFAWKNKMRIATPIFGVVMVGIWFAAVYTSHHYVLDVLAGILCAIAGIALFNLLLARWAWFRRFVDKYESFIRK